MTLLEAFAITEAWSSHARSLSLCAARLIPVVFLCPFLGGPSSPPTVRLAVVLALSIGLHFGAGVGESQALDPWAFASAVVRETVFGLALGLIASLPFDAARMGGRFIDLFRGTSAEAVLPVSGTREAVTGDALFHLAVSLSIASGAAGVLTSAVWRTYAWVAPGVATPTEELTGVLLRVVASAFAAGLAIGAPVAALSLAIDAALGLFARAAPGLQWMDTGAPLRILGGGAVIWLSLGVVSHRLLSEVEGAERALSAVAEAAR